VKSVVDLRVLVDIIYAMNEKRTVCSVFTAVISSLDKLETGSALLLRR